MRIGVLTGGGDAPGTNAVIRALTRSLVGQHQVQVVGIEDGFLGMIERRTRPLDLKAVNDEVATGGTMLGSTNRASPLAYQGRDWRREVVSYAGELGLDGLVAIGGDGTLAIADALDRCGLRTVGVPKTIDNDIAGVERSFGFDTAVARAAEALDRIHTTGESLRRVMLVETMGRHAGWIALEAGIAAGADMILLPELAFELEAVIDLCRQRERQERYTVICVSEGAMARGGEAVVRARVEGAPEPERLGGIAAQLAAQIEPHLSSEVRAVVLGHVQRGGPPTATDRVLATRYGAEAAQMVLDGAWGQTVAMRDGAISRAPLSDVAGRRRCVPVDHPLLKCAASIGVSFGQRP